MHPILEEIQALGKCWAPTKLLSHPKSRNGDKPVWKPWEWGLGEGLSIMHEEGRFPMEHFGAGKLSKVFFFLRPALAQELNFLKGLENIQLQHSKDLKFLWQVQSPLGVVAASLEGFIYIPILVWLVTRLLNSHFLVGWGSPNPLLQPCIRALASWNFGA